MRVFALVICAVSLGCAAAGPNATEAKSLASRDMECSAERISVYRARGGHYVAEGCGKWTEYRCITARRDALCVRDKGPFENATFRDPSE